MRQLKITKQVTNRETASLDKYLQEIGRVDLITAEEEVELAQRIKAGDQMLMWYLSGNRDEDVFERGEELIIDRQNARNHLSFGFGIHRCMGNRLAEMQLRVLWEEILKRFENIEVVGDVERTFSSFVKGYTSMPVRVTRKN